VRRWLTAGIKNVDEAATAVWLPKFATVAGELPLEDVTGWVRFDVDVIKPGRYQLTFNNATGLGVYLDGARASVPQHELGAGRHVFLVSVDRTEREGAGLRCQVDAAPGSAGELRIIDR
jgi:hypothetical protein